MSELLVDRTLGTVFGNLTDTAPIGNCYDGNNSQAVSGGAGPCPLKGGGGGVGYVGRNRPSKRYSRARLYGGSDFGFDNGTGSTTITWYLKNSAPASGTDGTASGSVTFTDVANNTARDITCTNGGYYTYSWFNIVGPGGTNIACAEVEEWELISAIPLFSRPLRIFTRRF